MNMCEGRSKLELGKRRRVNASLRLFPAIVLALYAFLLPIHLFSSHHYFGSEEQLPNHTQSDSHHHDDGDHDGDSGHKPHYAGDHSLAFTLQKQLSFTTIDFVLFPPSNIEPLIDSSFRLLLLVAAKARPLGDAPPTSQDSRAPPSI